MKRADVRMVELGDGARLALEAGAHLGCRGQVRGQHLDGDVAAQARVVGAVDLAHAARAERGEDPVGTERRARGQHGLSPNGGLQRKEANGTSLDTTGPRRHVNSLADGSGGGPGPSSPVPDGDDPSLRHRQEQPARHDARAGTPQARPAKPPGGSPGCPGVSPIRRPLHHPSVSAGLQPDGQARPAVG